MKIETKYSIGDRVFSSHAYWSKEQVECPDCLGKKEWEVTTPTGEKFTAPCNTCMRGYFSTGMVDDWGYNPKVDLLTVGQVKLEIGYGVSYTNGEAQGREEKYMCTETGCGSGQVHHVADLFDTMEEAMENAKALAVKYAKDKKENAEKEKARKKKDRIRK